MSWKHWLAGAVAVAAIACSLGPAAVPRAEAESKATSKPAPEVISGRELFSRQWLPSDPRSRGGDGLGPVFNDTSCVACHNQGGVGGAGAASQNVDIVSVFLDPSVIHQGIQPQQSVVTQLARALLNIPPERSTQNAEQRRAALKRNLEAELKGIHPGFLTAQSLVVHKFSVDDQYEPWRQRLVAGNMNQVFMNSSMPMATPVFDEAAFETPVDAVPAEALELPPASEAVPQGGQAGEAIGIDVQFAQTSPSPFAEFSAGHGDGERMRVLQVAQMRSFNRGSFSQVGRFTLSTSQRNTTALFGAGRLDSIPDDVLLAQAKKNYPDFPEISGRVSRLKGEKIGRFGWKSQTASLEDFALTACAVELGLNVPGHTQAGLAYNADYRAPGLDMTREECDALVSFLQELPAPVQELPSEPAAADFFHEGKALFATVGCANCHAENLGEVAGVYSDLLLHDMGPALQDQGDYGVFVPDSPGGDQEPIIEQLLKNSNPVFQPQVAAAPTTQPTQADESILGARRDEWRTPPLWGVRDSAPYLHDGRAQTLEEAIAFHDGEARRSAAKFFELKPSERLKVVMFLKSLAAPQVAAK